MMVCVDSAPACGGEAINAQYNYNGIPLTMTPVFADGPNGAFLPPHVHLVIDARQQQAQGYQAQQSYGNVPQQTYQMQQSYGNVQPQQNYQPAYGQYAQAPAATAAKKKRCGCC